MKKNYKILLLVLVLTYPVCKGLWELFWVKRYSIEVGDLTIRIRSERDMFGFLDAFEDKEIKIRNRKTNADAKLKYSSDHWRTNFYILDDSGGKKLCVLDTFDVQNIYDYKTLTLLRNEQDRERGGSFVSGTYDTTYNLGTLVLIYDGEGFHRVQ